LSFVACGEDQARIPAKIARNSNLNSAQIPIESLPMTQLPQFGLLC
jgi:hypothetical protein